MWSFPGGYTDCWHLKNTDLGFTPCFRFRIGKHLHIVFVPWDDDHHSFWKHFAFKHWCNPNTGLHILPGSSLTVCMFRSMHPRDCWTVEFRWTFDGMGDGMVGFLRVVGQFSHSPRRSVVFSITILQNKSWWRCKSGRGHKKYREGAQPNQYLSLLHDWRTVSRNHSDSTEGKPCLHLRISCKRACFCPGISLYEFKPKNNGAMSHEYCQNSNIMKIWNYSWRFQAIWKTWVKLEHFPKFRSKKYIYKKNTQSFINHHMCHGQKSLLGMVIPPLIGILIMGI